MTTYCEIRVALAQKYWSNQGRVGIGLPGHNFTHALAAWPVHGLAPYGARASAYTGMTMPCNWDCNKTQPSANHVLDSCDVPIQWETTLHCNVVSHWMGAYAKWSLVILYIRMTHQNTSTCMMTSWHVYTTYYWPFVRGIHRSPDPLTRGQLKLWCCCWC